MKKVYFVELGDKIVGYHEDYDVVLEYSQSLQKENVAIGRVKKKSIIDKGELEDLYLMRCGDKYIPCKYLDLYDMSKQEFSTMFKDTRNSLITLIEMVDSKKDVKAISKVLDIIGRLENELEDEPFEYDEMNNRYEDYNNYKYNVRKE